MKDTAQNDRITPVHKRVLFIFGTVFLILLLSVLPWAKFGVTFFDNFHRWIQSIPILKDILGAIKPFGHWDTPELSVLFLIAAILVGFVGKFTEKEFMDNFFAGVSDVMSVAFVIAIAYGVKIIMDDGNITATILYYGENVLSKLSGSIFACVSFLFYLPLSFFIPSSSGLATLSIPLLAPLADFAKIDRDIILMGALTITRVPYSVYIKSVLKLVVAILCVILIMLYLAPII